jgi:hypothetical protein
MQYPKVYMEKKLDELQPLFSQYILFVLKEENLPPQATEMIKLIKEQKETILQEIDKVILFQPMQVVK